MFALLAVVGLLNAYCYALAKLATELITKEKTVSLMPVIFFAFAGLTCLV